MSEQCDAEIAERLGDRPGSIPYTREELGALYDLMLEGRECLTSEGYTISEPSSREAFISASEAVAAGTPADPWDPWNDAGDPSAYDSWPFPTGQDVWEYIHGS